MHIIIDATTTQDEMQSNGIGVYTRHIIRFLIKGFPKSHFTLLLFDGESKLDPYLDPKPANVSIERIGPKRSNNFLNRLWFKKQILPGIKRVIRGDSIYFSPYFWRGLPVKTLPTISMIHDFILPLYNIYSQKSFVHNLIRKIQYKQEMKRMNQCRGIVANSQNTANDFSKYFPNYDKNRIKVALLGIDLPKNNDGDFVKHLPKDWQKRKYVIYLGGGLTKNKNSEGVLLGYKQFLKKLEANSKINKADAPYLVIAGKNFLSEYEQKSIAFRELVKAEDLEESVVFAGFYDDKDRYELLKNSFVDILIPTLESRKKTWVNVYSPVLEGFKKNTC